MLFNLHTHTRFSDGSSEPEEYIAEALKQGFSTLGFSDHSPVPFENSFAIKEEQLQEYIDKIGSLKLRYPTPGPSPKWGGEKGEGLQILLALEVDYIPGLTRDIDYYRAMNCFDYFIGSVHLVKNEETSGLWFIDGPEISIYDKGLKEAFNGDIRKAVTAYYHQVNQMILTQKPDIIGHLDKVKMYNRGRYFSESEKWYINLVDETLQLILEKNIVAEVNTRGLYKQRSDTLFPGIEILRKMKSLGIPVTISSDAHKPHELSLLYRETAEILKGIGFSSIALKVSGGWEEVPLS